MAVLLSSIVAATVWVSVSNYLLGQRQEAAFAQSAAHAELLTANLGSPGASAPRLLAGLSRSVASVSLLRVGGEWFASSLLATQEGLPTDLRESVSNGRPMYQRIELRGGPVLIVGIPLPEVGGIYFEIFSLEELEQTLQALSLVLLGTMFVIPVGSLLLGWWALRPALRPLERVASAAAAIASGDLSARMDPQGDPSLTSIAASFNDTAEALERRVRADAKFAADVSHELRSPLTTMMTAASLMDRYRTALPAEGREALDLMEEEVNRFSRLVEDLLEISRSDAGSADLVLQPLSLTDVVGQILPARLRDRLTLTPAAAGATVCVDKRRLERVVMNLVDNAERHGGGLTRLRLDAAGPAASIWVEDAGPGLAEAERQRIFERFARGRRSGRDSTHGAGLGLSIVARHVQVMGGTLMCGNRSEGGARFVVTVPTEGAGCHD